MENPDSAVSPHRRGPSHHHDGDGAARPRARSREGLRLWPGAHRGGAPANSPSAPSGRPHLGPPWLHERPQAPTRVRRADVRRSHNIPPHGRGVPHIDPSAALSVSRPVTPGW